MFLNDYEKFKTLDELVQVYQTKNNVTKTDAKKAVLSAMPKESRFQAKIMEYLNSRKDCIAWKDQASMYQSKGVPDIICIKDGIFYGFEVKRPFIGKLSDIQAEFHNKLKSVGARVYVVSFVSEVQRILDSTASV